MEGQNAERRKNKRQFRDFKGKWRVNAQKKHPNRQTGFKKMLQNGGGGMNGGASEASGASGASRMVPLCAECLWTVAELMDMTQDRAWNPFSVSKKCL